MIYCFCAVGKNNEPLYISTDFGSLRPSDSPIISLEESLHLQNIAFCSIDIIEERKKKFATSAPGSQDLYLGQLLTMSDYKSFGLCSNTFIKLILICDNITTENSAIKDILFSLYTFYIQLIQNPFYSITSNNHTTGIQSRVFKLNVQQLIQKFNSNSNNFISPIKK